MRRAAYAVAFVSAIAVAVPWVVAAQTPPEDQALDRIERKYGQFEWGCIDFCGGYELHVETPADVAEVDVVVTATISYRLATGHRGSATIGRVVGPPISPPNTTLLRGERWTLASTGGHRSTTTLTWFARNVPAAGVTQHFILEFRGGSPLRKLGGRDAEGGRRRGGVVSWSLSVAPDAGQSGAA
jgi:hypothetical protein